MKNSKSVALVTGASSGIGKALVVELLAQGYEVIGLSRTFEKLENVKDEVQSDHLSLYVCDVSSRENVRDVSAQIKKNHKIPTLFFLNAGIAGLKAMESIERLDIEAHEKIFSVNYFGVLNVVQEWLQACKEHGGASFVVSSSINAIFAPPGGSGYSASKAAISKAFDGLQLTHMKCNLKFLTVFCGPVDTPGLAGKLPFTWAPEKMAKYMIRRAEKGKIHSYPSRFYLRLCKLFNLLPGKQVIKLLGSKQKQSHEAIASKESQKNL